MRSGVKTCGGSAAITTIWFEKTKSDGHKYLVERRLGDFHVGPPQGRKIISSSPKWNVKGRTPLPLSWLLKKCILPPIYWTGMLKGKEWRAKLNPKGRDETADIVKYLMRLRFQRRESAYDV